jgi:hypothetical protein
LAELYGQGVHAYFRGDVRTAHQFFSDAIEQGSRDPRCYFYRGLAYASLGRPTEAEADYKSGAALEVSSTDRIYPVSDSLQRIQGRTRLQIEKHRQVARLTAHTKATQVQKARYEQLKRSEPDVLRAPDRGQSAAVPQELPQPMGPQPMGPEPMGAASDPFAGAAAAAPEKAPEKPAQPEMPTVPETDPFGVPATPAAPPTPPAPANDATTNPFEDDKPAAMPAAPATPPAADDNPFN